MNRTYLRGDLYFADLDCCVGSEQRGNRPVLILQNDTGNRYSPTVIVAAVTGKTETKGRLPTHCYIGPENGLERPSIVLLEQLRTLDKRRLGNYIGHLDDEHMKAVDRALAVSLSLTHQEPDTLILCLCGTCADQFRNTGSYLLRRVNPGETRKDCCTYCGQRSGYDYEVIPRK